jgi:site-specific DNA recombinase
MNNAMNGYLQYTPNEKTTALYVRISDDEKKRGSYDSISNQIKILKELAVKKGLTNLEVYRDDGKTGGNFDRPAFNQMIADIENTKLNCILVKDLSRFGREHINGDYYLEIFLPKHNVRFITQHEGFDSYTDPKRMNSIEVPLLNLFNEQYLKQVSNSTKASLKIKRKEGKYVGSQVPYGYLRSPEDKHKLIIDHNVRQVIEDIFSMYINHISLNEIAKILESRKILPPSQYKRQRKGLGINPDVIWRSHIIKKILSQDILMGNMVQGKTASYSHKVKKRMSLPREQWTIVENTHEAIVDAETFDKVQVLLSKETRPKTDRKAADKTLPSVLSGFVVCADCNKQMQRTMTNKNGTRHYYMRCATNKQLGSSACSSHLISENVILDVLTISINSLIDSFADIERAVRKNANNEINLIRNRQKHQLSKALNEREEIEKSRTKLYHTYINKLDDMLSDDMYVEMRTRLEKMYKEVNENIVKLKQDTERLNSDKDFTTEFMQNYSKYQGVTILTRDIIADLVDKILISKDKAIKIVFKFQDEVKKYASFFESSITDDTLAM